MEGGGLGERLCSLSELFERKISARGLKILCIVSHILVPQCEI